MTVEGVVSVSLLRALIAENGWGLHCQKPWPPAELSNSGSGRNIHLSTFTASSLVDLVLINNVRLLCWKLKCLNHTTTTAA